MHGRATHANLVSLTRIRSAAPPAQHPLAHHSTVDVTELHRESFLISPRQTVPYLYDTILTHYKRCGFTLKIRPENRY